MSKYQSSSSLSSECDPPRVPNAFPSPRGTRAPGGIGYAQIGVDFIVGPLVDEPSSVSSQSTEHAGHCAYDYYYIDYCDGNGWVDHGTPTSRCVLLSSPEQAGTEEWVKSTNEEGYCVLKYTYYSEEICDFSLSSSSSLTSNSSSSSISHSSSSSQSGFWSCPELVTNGTFDAGDANWTSDTSPSGGGVGFTDYPGAVRLTNGGAYVDTWANISQSVRLNKYAIYIVSFDVVSFDTQIYPPRGIFVYVGVHVPLPSSLLCYFGPHLMFLMFVIAYVLSIRRCGQPS